MVYLQTFDHLISSEFLETFPFPFWQPAFLTSPVVSVVVNNFIFIS